MRHAGRHALIAAAALAGCVAAAAPSSAVVKQGDTLRRASDQRFVPGEAIVRFKRGTTAGERRRARSRASVAFERSTGISQAQVVDIQGSVAAAVARLERQPDVLYAQPNYRYRKLAPEPNDTDFDELWGLNNTGQSIEGSTGLAAMDVRALAAWDTTRGGGTMIAVVDSGIDKFHPDLAPNLVPGFDFVNSDSDADDTEFHGTHVAGTAAAVENNSRGVAGVAPDAKLMPVRALDGDGGGSSADIGDGIAFAANNGADVINLSLGGPAGPGDDFMSNAVDVANARNAVVVAAAGNDDLSNNDVFPVTPCTLPQPNLICVASLDNDGGLSGFSNVGRSTVDVGAPGGSVLSARTGYDDMPLTNPGFETGAALTPWTTTGTPLWSTSGTANSGDRSATSGTYAANANGKLVSADVDFTGRRGCRLNYAVRADIDQTEGPPFGDPDFFDAYASKGSLEDPPLAERGLTGSTGSAFSDEETSVEALSGQSGVSLNFQIVANGDSNNGGGAFVDDVKPTCRSNMAQDGYLYFSGTSMAAPHVAGVAALLRAADPGAPDTQIVQALREGVDARTSLAGLTVTGGSVNAVKAIARVRALPNPSPPVPPAPVVPPTAPARANLRGAKRSIRVRRGRFSYSFRAGPRLRGTASFRSLKRVRVSARRKVTLARKSFRVPSTGKVTLRIKLSRKNLRILRRNRRIKLRVTVKLRNAAGLSSTATKTLTLRI